MAIEFVDSVIDANVKHLQNLVFDVTKLIKTEKDISKAAKMVIDNNLTLDQLIHTTRRLSIDELVNLTDQIISLK